MSDSANPSHRSRSPRIHLSSSSAPTDIAPAPTDHKNVEKDFFPLIPLDELAEIPLQTNYELELIDPGYKLKNIDDQTCMPSSSTIPKSTTSSTAPPYPSTFNSDLFPLLETHSPLPTPFGTSYSEGNHYGDFDTSSVTYRRERVRRHSRSSRSPSPSERRYKYPRHSFSSNSIGLISGSDYSHRKSTAGQDYDLFEFPSISPHSSRPGTPTYSLNAYLNDGNASCTSNSSLSPLELSEHLNGFGDYLDHQFDLLNTRLEPQQVTTTRGTQVAELNDNTGLKTSWADRVVYIARQWYEEFPYRLPSERPTETFRACMRFKWALKMDDADHSASGAAFQGLDVNSIFQHSMPVPERFDKMFSWNDRVNVSMQRYHLPMIGKILSSRDQTFSFRQIPVSQFVLDTMSNVIFERHLITPAASASSMPSSPLHLNTTNHPNRIPTHDANEVTSRSQRIIVCPEIFEELDFALACSVIGHWVGLGPHENEGIPNVPDITLSTLITAHEKYTTMQQQFIDSTRMVIKSPYDIYPRRLWDLKTNRVIPTFLFHLPWFPSHVEFPEYVAISHSWVQEGHLKYIETPINQGAWTVPLPKSVELDHVRNEVLGYFPSIRYCWLDVLCLRQQNKPPTLQTMNTYNVSSANWLAPLELSRHDLADSSVNEMGIDVPTIGNIYKHAVGVLRYFNGLGRRFRIRKWDDDKHWLNRAWTLQESMGVSVNGGVELNMNPLNTVSEWRQERKSLREILDSIKHMVQGFASRGSIMLIACEMAKRHASHEVDKIAGLSYLLRFDELPIYSRFEAEDYTWRRCLNSAPPAILAELFFNCPFASLFGLFPSWRQLITCPESFVLLSLPRSSVLKVIDNRRGFLLNENLGEFQFSGYQLIGQIHHTRGNYRVIAQAKPEPRFSKLAMNLNFFSSRKGQHLDMMEVILNDPNTQYELFTHNLTPGSSWVVISNGKKIGTLCTDEIFTGFHRSQVLRKGYMTKKSVSDGLTFKSY